MAHFEVRGKGHPIECNAGPFEGSHCIATVHHPWLISGGRLPETRGWFSADC